MLGVGRGTSQNDARRSGTGLDGAESLSRGAALVVVASFSTSTPLASCPTREATAGATLGSRAGRVSADRLQALRNLPVLHNRAELPARGLGEFKEATTARRWCGTGSAWGIGTDCVDLEAQVQ